MFIVRWEGGNPRDKAAWIAALREALAGETGSYRVCFLRAPGGWRFVVDHRPGPEPEPFPSPEPMDVEAEADVSMDDWGQLMVEDGAETRSDQGRRLALTANCIDDLPLDENIVK